MAKEASSGGGSRRAASSNANAESKAPAATSVKRTGQGRTMHITDSKGNTKHVYAGQTYSSAEAAKNARSEDAAIRAEQAQQRTAWNPFLDEAPQTQQSRYSQEANRERTAEQKEKDEKRETSKSFLDEANRLEQEKASKSDVWENGIYIGMDKAISDEYDRKIAEARAKSDEALAEVNTTDKQRDDILAAYLKAVDDENAIAGFATDPMSQQAADAARVAREQAEDALKEENRRLGNDVYFGLADEAQSRDLFEGWAGERAAGSAAALGTGLEWLGEKTNVDSFSDAGSTLFNAAQGWQGQAQEDWASGTSTMSETEKQIAGLGKTAADMTMDMIENFIVPGAGRVAMAARVAGGGALTQADRERNDVDARMTKAVLDGGVAFLSEYLLGGAEKVYGKSIVGKGLEKMFGKASPVLKTVLNTEGLEEGLEYALGYLGDKLLKLDPNGEFSADELKQNMLVGYIMGVLFNGIAGGLEYTAPKLKAVVDEAYDATAQGITPQEAADQARLQPNEEVKIDPSKQVAEPETEAEPVSEPEPVEEAPEPDVLKFNNSMDNGEQSEWHTFVRDTLSGGAVSDADINKIITSREGRQAFSDVTGLSLKGMSEDAVRQAIGMAAGSVPTQAAEAGATPTPEGPMRGSQRRRQIDWLSPNPTISNIQELGTITPRQAAQIRNNADLRAEFERVYEISLDGLGEKAALDAITNAVTGARANDVAVESWESERGTIPAAEPSFANEGPGEKGSKDWKEYKRATKARQDVADILAGTELTRKDATRLMTDEIMWEAFQDATGISLGNKPKTEQNIREAFREAKANQNQEGQAETKTETAEPQTAEETAQDAEAETTAETNANEMPLGTEPTQEANDTAGEIPNQEQANTNENAGQNETAEEQQNPNPGEPFDDRSAPGTGKEKTSQSFSNTLTREEGDSVRDPLSYLSKSDVETTQRAMERLGMNGEAEMAAMMSNEMWNDEQVQMSNIIRKNLFADAQKSGDWKAYDTFRKVYDEHMRVIARALRQAGNYDGQSAEGIARMAGQYLDMMENNAKEDLARDPNNKKAKDDLVEIDKARQATNETAGEIGALEAEEAELIKNGMSEEEAWNKVKDRYLDLGQKLVAQRNMGLILDNVLFKNARIRRGSKTVNTLLKKMLSTRSPEYIRNFVRANNAGLATDATYKVHPTAKQVSTMIGSLHKMCMLFGTGTTLRNTESNAVFGAIDWASNNAGGALADSVIGLMTGNRSRGLEAGIFSGNTWKAAWDAGVESVLEIAANMDMREDGKYVTGTQAFSPYNPGTRLIARLNQVLGYALNTTDAVAYAGAQESASNAAQRANSRRGGNMTDETAKAIGEGEAAFRTLKDKNVATEILTEVQQAFDLLGFGGEIQYKNVGGKKIAVGRKGGFGLGSFNVPFVGVPVNLKLKPLQYTAPGAALGAIHAAQAVKLAKGADPNSAEMQESLKLQHQASGEIGRGVTGTAMLIALMSLLKKAKEEGKEWFKDWDLEEDKDVKAQNRAEGKFGQQINLSMLDRIRNGEDPGRWQHRDDTVDISSNEPTNSFLQMASIMADDEDAPIPEALFKALWQTEKSNLSDLPCLDAINNFRDTFNNNPVYNEATDTDEDGNLEEPTVNEWKTFLNATGAMAGSSASGFTFAPLRHYAAATDEYQRDTSADNALQSAWNRTLLGIPGKYGRESLPIKTDNYGNPLSNGDKSTRIKNAYLAMKYGTIQQSEVSEEVERIREETGVSLTPPRYAPKTITFGSGKDKEKVRLTSGEGKEYSTTRGQEFEQRYQELMSNPLYQNADSDTQAAMGSKLEAFAKDSAKADVAENHGIEYESQFDYAREMDDPVAFLAAQAGIAQAERDGNLDVVDMILQSVRSQNMSRQEEEAYGKHIQGFDKLNYLTENGMRTERAQTFDTDLKELYESEKRTAARGSDYFRTACSGRYSPEEADAIMSYETAITQETEDNYKDRVQYNLDQAGLGNIQGTVWGWIEECADGNMTTSQFNKNLSKAGIPAKQQYEIKQVRESMTEDKHMVGKTVSGIYRAMREVGYTPEEALQFYEMCDPNYNGSYTKREFDSAVNKAFGNSSYGRQVRSLIRQYVGK